MRLTDVQTAILKRVAAEVFGPQARLYLFGSHTDDSLRGGDIDLYVTGLSGTLDELLNAKLHFLVKAKRQLGDRRIDLVFAPAPGQAPLPIQRRAAQTGIPL
ncbi:nucleotidyltransferase domain-containing protein [Methylococcus sp. Mc7]|uniref:nucleotidyltransferase domain-containing protein n=1 Tax=Methylococcus sp. Mc7 TaxID=2860258 RepID=UPI001C532EEC|nr:nucleotidyltransferase domain-containing protein [Methylococcus sp. Mc7]QXP84038.1 nucleotidyltransferase domain-containing protein [Methylococcus sp. Mc7]